MVRSWRLRLRGAFTARRFAVRRSHSTEWFTIPDSMHATGAIRRVRLSEAKPRWRLVSELREPKKGRSLGRRSKLLLARTHAPSHEPFSRAGAGGQVKTGGGGAWGVAEFFPKGTTPSNGARVRRQQTAKVHPHRHNLPGFGVGPGHARALEGIGSACVGGGRVCARSQSMRSASKKLRSIASLLVEHDVE